jgi:hypothetical protein
VLDGTEFGLQKAHGFLIHDTTKTILGLSTMEAFRLAFAVLSFRLQVLQRKAWHGFGVLYIVYMAVLATWSRSGSEVVQQGAVIVASQGHWQ